MLSVVMPCHNEERYLEAAVGGVVDGLRTRGRPFEVILVENGSSDSTLSLAKRLSGCYPEVRSDSLPDPDYGAALKAGFEQAQGDIVANFDVDLVDLEFLDRALEVMSDRSVAAVVGSKRARGATDRRSPGRRFVTGVFSVTLSYGFGLSVSDTHGLKTLRRESLAPVVAASRFGKDIFDTELLIRAERAGLRIAEIPVSVDEIRPARTPISRRIPRTLAGLAALRVALWREALRPPSGRGRAHLG
jgi:glycosyltransferase involved in cell wall biosynthesis